MLPQMYILTAGFLVSTEAFREKKFGTMNHPFLHPFPEAIALDGQGWLWGGKGEGDYPGRRQTFVREGDKELSGLME